MKAVVIGRAGFKDSYKDDHRAREIIEVRNTLALPLYSFEANTIKALSGLEL